MIQDEAKKHDSVFFAFAGEGHDLIRLDIECEDMSGWLIPNTKVKEFEKLWEKDNSMVFLKDWADYFIWAVWEIIEEKIVVFFKAYA